MAGELDSNSPLSPERLLIEAAQREAARLETTPIGRTDSISEAATSIDAMRDSFPGYKITREIHRGGQGVVYQAIHKGTKRKVAIKVMRDGPFASARERTRFDREMQILGQLNDPHIVQIHDASSVGGCQYYVMDYISGHALDLYMSSRRWTIDETLRLFLKICEAVNAAHVRGVIHRDLKPGNIRIDQEGEPHILDFGLAKVAVGETSNDSQAQLMSITGEFIGSLPWASPEQAEGIPGKIDIRTDVYSLGVILYQMLTGTFPYLVVGPMRTVMDNILLADPIKPRTVRREIDDEVETIVLKCLNKDRDRRYQTAGELSRDVGHYLSGEPIEAKRDSNLYVLRKALARYKIAVVVAGLFVLVIVAGLVTSLTYWGRAEQQRTEADVARNRAEAERTRAEEERTRAEAERKRANSNLTFLTDTLLAADPERANRVGMTIRDAIRWAASRVGEKFKDSESREDEAAVRYTIGEVLKNHAFFEEAETHLIAATEIWNALHGGQSLEVAKGRHALAAVYWQQDLPQKALPLYQDALRIRMDASGPDDPLVTDTRVHIGFCLALMGQDDEAERILVDALKFQQKQSGDNRREIASAYNRLAWFRRGQKQFAEAEEYYHKGLDLLLALYKEKDGKHLLIARTRGSLGECLLDQKRCEEARDYLMQAAAMKQDLVDLDSLTLANSRQRLARLNLECDPKDLHTAESHCNKALEMRLEKLPERHHHVGETRQLLGSIRLAKDGPEAAIPELRKAVDILRLTLPVGHWRTTRAERVLHECEQKLASPETASGPNGER